MGIFDRAAGVARRLPLGEVPARALELAGTAAGRAEHEFFTFVRTRMEASIAPVPQADRLLGKRPDPTPRDLMADLLGRAGAPQPTGSDQDWCTSVLAQIVPDEARILATLAEEGRPVPLVHVLPRSGTGRILENATLVGRAAGLTLPAMAPTYVAHLVALGIADTAPEDDGNEAGYDLLLEDPVVRRALRQGEAGGLPARVLRRTLVLTDRGQDLWERTRPVKELS